MSALKKANGTAHIKAHVLAFVPRHVLVFLFIQLYLTVFFLPACPPPWSSSPFPLPFPPPPCNTPEAGMTVRDTRASSNNSTGQPLTPESSHSPIRHLMILPPSSSRPYPSSRATILHVHRLYTRAGVEGAPVPTLASQSGRRNRAPTALVQPLSIGPSCGSGGNLAAPKLVLGTPSRGQGPTRAPGRILVRVPHVYLSCDDNAEPLSFFTL